MTITWRTFECIDWCYDSSNNSCSTSKFGSKEAAEEALKSLHNCSYCSDCYDCIDCAYCSGCTDCSDCSYCSDCYDCIDCAYCSSCSYCTSCVHGFICSNRNDSDKTPPIPKLDNIHQQVYAAASQSGALNMGRYHICSTTHCRAGWVVTLAGEQGRELEKYYGSALAALMIYRQSSPLKVTLPRFFDTEKEALKDMKRLAEEEKTSTEV